MNARILVGIGLVLGCNNSAPAPAKPQPQLVAVTGTVRDAASRPVAGATVTLVAETDELLRTTTDANGRYHFAIAPHAAWGASAHHAAHVGGHVESRKIDGNATLDIALGNARGFALHGKVVGEREGATYVAITETDPEKTGDVWTADIRADGTFSAIVPQYSRYVVDVKGGPLGSRTLDGEQAAAEIEIEATHVRPAPREASDWLAANGARLAGTDPALPLDDLAALDAIVKDAKLVGLGEATHGTREYFQLKHRIARYLVEKRGFTTFALEANLPECRALDAYIKGGAGDPRKLLANTYFWVWQTEEVLALVEWLRAWNADKSHAQVSFVGFDMQFEQGAVRSLSAFAKVEATSTVDGWRALETRVAAMPDLPVDVRDDVIVLHQLLASEAEPDSWKITRLRDRFMADNLIRLAARHGKLIVWAHNEHVERDYEFAMGTYLAKHFGAAYVPIGFVFDGGSLRAAQTGVVDSEPTATYSVEPAAETNIAAAFAHTGVPLMLVDLRAAPAYFARPQLTREIGWKFTTPAGMEGPTRLAKRFIAAIYVARSTPSRLLPL